MFLLTLSLPNELRLRCGLGLPLRLDPRVRVELPQPDRIVLIARRGWWGTPPGRPVHRVHALLQAKSDMRFEDLDPRDPVLRRVRWRSLRRPFALEGLQRTGVDYFDEPALATLDDEDADAITGAGVLSEAAADIARFPLGDPMDWEPREWPPLMILDGPGSFSRPYCAHWSATEWERVGGVRLGRPADGETDVEFLREPVVGYGEEERAAD